MAQWQARRVTRVAGIDGVGSVWIAVVVEDGALHWQLGHASEVLALAHECDLVAIDIPIGFVDSGMRACEAEARVLLGAQSRSIFPTPPAAAMAVGRREGTTRASRERAQQAARLAGGQGISTQTWGLAAKILDVEDAIDALPHPAASRVVETHPETAFRIMSPGPGPVWANKKSAAGVARRMALLDVEAAAFDDPVLTKVPIDDALDALAAAWTAARLLRDDARVLGGSDAARAVWSDGTSARGRAVIWV